MSFEEILKTLGSGLGQFGWNDLLDIAILTVLLYKLIVWTKDTRAYEVIKGVGLLIVASVATQLLSMYTLNWLLDSILQSGTIIIVIFILFTPEIRRVLERLGRSGKAIGKLISEAGNMGVEDLIDGPGGHHQHRHGHRGPGLRRADREHLRTQHPPP